MINKKLLFSVRESIPFIKKNVLYQWIGLVCNVLSTACLCWIITRHRSISLVGILFYMFNSSLYCESKSD